MNEFFCLGMTSQVSTTQSVALSLCPAMTSQMKGEHMSVVRASVNQAGAFRVYDLGLGWTVADYLSEYEAQHLANELNRIAHR